MSDQPAPLIPSATILLIRETPELQVFMAKRHHQIDFASGALVFPGGKSTDDDTDSGWAARCDGDLGDLTTAGISAIRETWEESGLLFARHATTRGPGAPLIDAEAATKLDPHRAAVDKGETSFHDLIAANELVLALDRLTPYAHWITPEMMPKRFDTRFFLAETPAGQTAAHDGREATASEWLTPAEALRREAAGEATILFPTRLNLEWLTHAATCAEAIEQAKSRTIIPVMPKIIEQDGEKCLSIPPEAGYRLNIQPLAKERANATRKG
ncbi:MAG: NUDIX hydrolase [Pseudomonadota bacterium]